MSVVNCCQAWIIKGWNWKGNWESRELKRQAGFFEISSSLCLWPPLEPGSQVRQWVTLCARPASATVHLFQPPLLLLLLLLLLPYLLLLPLLLPHLLQRLLCPILAAPLCQCPGASCEPPLPLQPHSKQPNTWLDTDLTIEMKLPNIILWSRTFFTLCQLLILEKLSDCLPSSTSETFNLQPDKRYSSLGKAKMFGLLFPLYSSDDNHVPGLLFPPKRSGSLRFSQKFWEVC